MTTLADAVLRINKLERICNLLVDVLMEANTAGYIYSELQEVESCKSPDNKLAVGALVIVQRWMFKDQGAATPIMISLRDAIQMKADLERIFREYEEFTGHPVPTKEELDAGA
jgi:hypothetical protein